VSKKFDVYDLIDNDFVSLLSHVENDDIQKYNKNDFNEQFIIDLQKDLDILTDLSKSWKKVIIDPKIDKLKEYLKNELKNKQVILFSESSETVFYLKDNLQTEFE
jgi:ERCC4-related helicase